MVWTYPGEMRRASSLADLRGLLSGEAATTAPAVAAPTGSPTGGLTSAPTAGPCGPRRPIPQQLLPVVSDPPGCLDPQRDLLFFLLCDDLPDGEPVLGRHATLVDPDLAAAHDPVNPTLRDTLEQPDQEVIQTLPGMRVINANQPDVGRRRRQACRRCIRFCR
jgi:hypothetical protein